MLKVILAAAAAFTLTAQLAIADTFKAGEHYEVLPVPVVTSDKTKVEVVELFWYGCGHCFKFEPMLKTWKRQQGEDVVVLGQPAIWNKTMTLHAQAFYTAKALNVLDKMHPILFQVMNIEKNRLKNEDSIKAVFVKNGVDAEAFSKTFNSFGISSQVKLAESRARSYRMQGTPEMVVNGKYRIAAGLAGSQAKMLEVASFLIEKERLTLKVK
ncbi:MAG: thiol:disulfide interchange protein DsbA/DsbL [Pseudomonadales bacterium]|nr:thiol:disulfide interchange protein DsbA/DsbL [Pseudomonadales bacterium]